MHRNRGIAGSRTWPCALVVALAASLALAPSSPSIAAGTPAATLSLQAASDTGSSQTDDVTNAEALTYDVAFDRDVTGLAADDFSFTGTATNCTAGVPAGSDAAYSVTVTGCSAGTVALTLDADSVTDGSMVSGPATATAAPSVLIDRTNPTATEPSTAIRSGQTLMGTGIPVRVSWTGADPGGAGVSRYELERSTGDISDWAPLSTALTSGLFDLIVGPASTLRFRARTVDTAGNVGEWAYEGPLVPRLSQETSSVLTYHGPWKTASSSSYSGNAARYATAPGASATYEFIGRNVALVTTKAPSRGKVKVYVDGVYVVTIDLFGTVRYRSVVWQRHWAGADRHFIRFAVVGTAGRPRVDLDAVAVVR